ncbi:MAG: hypothetical protein ABMB14_40860 [Myxococcota bacterium]
MSIEAIHFGDLVDPIDAADPRTWNATHDALHPNDDPEVRWTNAASTVGCLVEHLTEDDNGLDH